MYYDNRITLHLAKNQIYHERSNNIDVRLHFVKDIICEGKVKLEKIPTEENPSNMLIKALSTSKCRHCLNLVNMKNY